MIMISNRGWRAIEETPRRSLYFDLLLERKSLKSGETSWTPASTIIVGLNAAIEILREEGLESVYARHELLSKINRAGLNALGFSLLAEDAPCPSVTGFKPPSGLDADTLRTEIRKRYGVRLAGGQGVLKGGIIRVGHMGNIDPFDAVNGLLAIGLTARALGARIDPKIGVDAALALLDCSA
jgi:aspartate aminotransferase-like enzyme